MPEQLPIPLGLVALDFAGDVGALTVYRTKTGRAVSFPRTSPKKPPTPSQRTQRKRFKDAMLAWHDLAPDLQEDYEHAVNVLSLPLTGLNLWISTSLTHDVAGLVTLANQAGVSLQPPPLF